MVKTLLVNVEIQQGAEILACLDEAGFPIKVAALCMFPDWDTFRLVLASPRFRNTSERDSMGLVLDVLRAAGHAGRYDLAFMPFTPTDPFIRDLRRRYGKGPHAEGRRIQGPVADRYVQDGYIFRIS